MPPWPPPQAQRCHAGPEEEAEWEQELQRGDAHTHGEIWHRLVTVVITVNISLKAYKEREKSRNANHGRCVVPPSVFISTHLLHPDIFFFLVCHPEALEAVLLFYISKQTRTQYCKMSWKTHPCPLMPFDVLKYKHLSGSHFLPPLPFIAASLPHHPLARCWKRA